MDFDRALPRIANGKLYKRLIEARYWPAKRPLVAHDVERHVTDKSQTS